uniref:Uncharacterized protein n=1 Tax=Xenorhabdus nematophila TaxID=628 RepID=B1H0T6_XENNE|nr:hypothetical protein [Xenorhabdus nematophila]
MVQIIMVILVRTGRLLRESMNVGRMMRLIHWITIIRMIRKKRMNMAIIMMTKNSGYYFG